MSTTRTQPRSASRRGPYRYEPGENPAMRVFHGEQGVSALPFLTIGAAVFELEKSLRSRRLRTLTIKLPPERPGEETLARIRSLLTELVGFVLLRTVEFRFEGAVRPLTRNLRTEIDLTTSDAVCLFSGGVDSYVGLYLATRQYGRRVDALFCAHQDQSKITRLVNELHRAVFEPRGVRLRQLSVPPIGKQGYAQLRGFLYLLSAAAWVHLLRASTLLLTECGPTMYQPKFGPLDRVTMTTHPLVVANSQRVIELMLGRPIDIIKPFENLTKAEVMALAPRKNALRQTHSCISQRFGHHDGTCYGCVLRRLAALAAGVPDVPYEKDPLVDEGANRGNLLALLRFSLDYLADPGAMEEYEVGEIESYGKEDLFRRFALDNFAGVHRLVLRRRRIAADVRRVYGYALQVLGRTRLLEERIATLAERRFQATF